MGKQKIMVGAVRVPGPLGRYAKEFESNLTECGYAQRTRAAHLRVMSIFRRWLPDRYPGAEDLVGERVEKVHGLRRGGR